MRTLIALSLGVVHLTAGDMDQGREWLEEGVRRYEGIGLSVSGLAALGAEAGRLEESLVLYQEALHAYHVVGTGRSRRGSWMPTPGRCSRLSGRLRVILRIGKRLRVPDADPDPMVGDIVR